MPIFTKRFRRKIKLFFVLLIPLAAIVGYAYFIEPNSLKVENQTFKLKCLKENLPEKFVQISDLHFTGQTKDGRIDQIYEAIKNINPSAVFMTGDYVSNKEGLEAVKKLVEKIAAKYPVYAVLGNWDYDVFGFNISEIRSVMEKAGAKVMINDAVPLGKGAGQFNLVGLKDPFTSGDTKSDLEKAIGKISSGEKKCTVLMAHSPDIIQTAKDMDIDLVLTGHTHGGQIYIPYFSERFIPVHSAGEGYIKGLYKAANTQMYVNRGIGFSVFPFRLGVPPEVTVISLEKN